MTTKKFLQVAVGLLVSAVFIYLIARQIPLDDILAALAEVQYSWVVAGVGCFAFGYFCRVRRWQLMLINENPAVSFGKAGTAFMVSIAANNVLPFRLGDVMRAFAFSKWLNVPSSAVLATLVAERLLDILALLVAFGLACLLLGLGTGAIAALLGAGSIGLVVLAVVIVVAFLYPQVMQPPVMYVLNRISPMMGSLGEKITNAAQNVFDTLKRVTRSGRTLALLMWSTLAWIGEAGVFLCAAYSVPALAVPKAAFLAMPVGTLSTLLPSSPGYVGTFHYFVIESAELLGNDLAAASAFAVVAHLILWTSATVLGGICFVVWSFTGLRYERFNDFQSEHD